MHCCHCPDRSPVVFHPSVNLPSLLCYLADRFSDITPFLFLLFFLICFLSYFFSVSSLSFRIHPVLSHVNVAHCSLQLCHWCPCSSYLLILPSSFPSFRPSKPHSLPFLPLFVVLAGPCSTNITFLTLLTLHTQQYQCGQKKRESSARNVLHRRCVRNWLVFSVNGTHCL